MNEWHCRVIADPPNRSPELAKGFCVCIRPVNHNIYHLCKCGAHWTDAEAPKLGIWEEDVDR